MPPSANTPWKRPTRCWTRSSASTGTDLAEELGDLLLQVLFYAQMGDEAGYFSIVDVLGHLNRKLIRRHPHVFGDEASAAAGNRAQVDTATASEAAGVLANWEAIKRAEKRRGKTVRTASAHRCWTRCRAVFLRCWKRRSWAARRRRSASTGRIAPGLLEKVEEECREIEAEVEAGAAPEAVEGEVGDLLFTVVNLARHLKVDPELALRRTNAKFRRRFAAMEQASDRALSEQQCGRA